ncbi:hypothetical protein D3C76_1488560 [compost metagenome]
MKRIIQIEDYLDSIAIAAELLGEGVMCILNKLYQESAMVLVFNLLRQAVHASVVGYTFCNFGKKNADLSPCKLRDMRMRSNRSAFFLRSQSHVLFPFRYMLLQQRKYSYASGYPVLRN